MTNITNHNNPPTGTETNVNEISQIHNKKFNFRLVLIILLSIIIGSILGGVSGLLNSKKATKIQTYKITKPVNVFPIDVSILQNPMFSEWSGRLKGRVRELKTDSFLISQVKEEFTPDGQIIVTDINNPNLTEIEIIEGITKFYVSSPSSSFGQTPVQVSYKQIQKNSVLEGNVKIKFDTSSNSLKLTGVSFTLR